MTSEIGDLRCSGSILGDFVCSWRLKNFSQLDAIVGTEYRSKQFICSGNLKWCLCIFPGGEYSWEEDEVHCYVKCLSAPENGVSVKYRFSFRDHVGDTIRSLCIPHSGYTSFRAGHRSFPLFLKRATLLSQLLRDELLVLLDGTYSFSVIMSQRVVEFSLEISPYGKLADSYKTLSKCVEGTDAVISVCGYNIPVHSMVLAARSTVFEAMLQNDCDHSKFRRVSITDFDIDTVQLLIQFLYYGKVDSCHVDQLTELMRAANAFKMHDFMVYCSQLLIPYLDDTNVIKLLLCADLHNAKELRCKAIVYFCQRRSFVEFEKDESLLKQHPDILCDLVQAMQKFC